VKNVRKRWRRIGTGAITAALVCGLTLNTAAQQRRSRRGPPRETSTKLFDSNPPRHIGEYPAFNIVWQTDDRLQDVRAVFPAPLSPQWVAVATGTGLLFSDDTAKTWTLIAGTSPDAIGEIRHIEFSTNNALYMATATKGIWQIDNLANLTPPKQLASKSTGLLSDAVTQLRIDTSDPSGQTLLAVHGSDAAGISRSLDAGHTWKPIPALDDYFIDKLLCGGPGTPWMFALACQKNPTGPRRIFFSLAVGDFFKDYAGDIQATDGALETFFEQPFDKASDLSYWSTADAGLLHIDHNGTDSQRLGPPEIDKWTSIGTTYGPTADSRIIYAYEPTKLGLAVSQDNGKTFTSFSQGLPTGGFVKQGAHVRANAGGSVFFAAINNRLYIGRRYTGAITITDLRVTPQAITYAPTRYGESLDALHNELNNFRNARTAAEDAPYVINAYHNLTSAASNITFTITARINNHEDAATGEGESKPPIAVTVDLSRIGGSPVTPMYDDGLHGDGAANDGIYGATSLLRPDRIRNHYEDIRRPSPGPIALTITAISPEGKLSSAVGVIGLLEHAETHAYWARSDWITSTGDLTTSQDDYRAAGDRKALKFQTKGKPWTLSLLNYYDHSVAGYDSLAFDIKTDGPSPKELYVQLQDASPDTVSALTVRVPVIEEKLVQGSGGGVIDKNFRRVVVPFSRLLKEPPDDSPRFRPTMLHAVVISADSDSQNYWISPILFQSPGADRERSK